MRAAPLRTGAAAPIATGARLPAGATAVLRRARGETDPATGTLYDRSAAPGAAPGTDIRAQGHECRTGGPLLPAGATVTPAVLGRAAAADHDRLTVHRRPTVELLVLGDELLTSGLPGGRPVVELREADDAAAGELLPAELDPAAPATAEQRAYLLPERLARQVFQEPRQPVRRRAAASAGRARRWASP